MKAKHYLADAFDEQTQVWLCFMALDDEACGEYELEDADRENCISTIIGWWNDTKNDIQTDARLIAAAPDLLAACKKDAERIRDLCRTVNDFAAKLKLGNKVHAEDWDDVARAAIAKAEGQQ